MKKCLFFLVAMFLLTTSAIAQNLTFELMLSDNETQGVISEETKIINALLILTNESNNESVTKLLNISDFYLSKLTKDKDSERVWAPKPSFGIGIPGLNIINLKPGESFSKNFVYSLSDGEPDYGPLTEGRYIATLNLKSYYEDEEYVMSAHGFFDIENKFTELSGLMDKLDAIDEKLNKIKHHAAYSYRYDAYNYRLNRTNSPVIKENNELLKMRKKNNSLEKMIRKVIKEQEYIKRDIEGRFQDSADDIRDQFNDQSNEPKPWPGN